MGLYDWRRAIRGPIWYGLCGEWMWLECVCRHFGSLPGCMAECQSCDCDCSLSPQPSAYPGQALCSSPLSLASLVQFCSFSSRLLSFTPLSLLHLFPLFISPLKQRSNSFFFAATTMISEENEKLRAALTSWGSEKWLGERMRKPIENLTFSLPIQS